MKNFTKYLRFLTLFLGLSITLNAQLPQVSISPNGNLTVCDGTVVNSSATVTNPFAGTTNYAISDIPFAPFNTNFGTTIHLVDDAISMPLPIGFSFCFFGNTYNQFYLSSNGWIGFSPGQTLAFTATTIPSTSWLVPRNCIMGPWMDWNPGVGTNIGNYIRYQIQGIAPYRRLVVTWTDTPLYQCTALNGTIQIVIYESTNIIENHITRKPVCTAWAGGTATQGLHNQAGTQAIVTPGRNATVWTANNEAKRFTPTGPPSYTVTWLANGIPVGTGNNISHTVNGNTQLIARVSFNCSSVLVYDTLNITVGGSVNANFAISNPASGSACAGQNVTYTYTGGAPASSTFDWSFPGATPNTANGVGPHTVNYPTAGNYTSALNVTQAACGTGNFSLPITIGTPATSTFTVTDPVCGTQNSTITYTGNAPAGATYNWNFNGGTIVSGSGQGPYQVNWTTPGVKNITLTVNNGGCLSNITTQSVNVQNAPTSTFTATSPACLNANSTITYTGNAPAGATYNWNFNGGTLVSGTGQGPYQINWATPGNKTITLNVTQGGCNSASTSQTVVVNTTPSANFTASSPICAGFVSTITYTGGAPAGSTFNWNFDGGTIVSGTGAGPYLVSWPTIGNKNIRLTVTQNGCTSTEVTQIVNVINTPVASFTYNPNVICQGVPLTVSFNGTAPAGATYNWNFGDATVISGTNAGPYQIVYNNSGPKTIFLSVAANGCTSPAVSESFNVTPAPTASFTIDSIVCEGGSAILTFNGTASIGAIFNWNFDGAVVTSGTGVGPYALTFPNQGIYNISLTLSEGSCTAPVFSQNVHAIPSPTVSFTMPANGCAGEPVSILYTGNAGAGATYNWDFGGATIISGSGPGPIEVVWNNPGNQTVSLYVQENGCNSNVISHTIEINQIPLFEIVSPALVNSGDVITISYAGIPIANGVYIWTFENGNPPSGSGTGPFNVTWNNPGDQQISLTLEVDGCPPATVSNPITVLSGADVSFNMDDEVCEGELVTITFTGTANPSASFNWNFDGGNIISGSGSGPYEIVWDNQGTKNVTCQATQYGIPSAIVSNQVNVNPIPTSSFSISGGLCSGLASNLVYNGSASPNANYNWNFGAGQLVAGGNEYAQVIFANQGNYPVSLTVEENGCISDPFIANLNVMPTPTADFELEQTLCEDENTIVLFMGAAPSNALYHWNFDGAEIVSGSGQGAYLINWNQEGNYNVSLVVNQHSCISDTFSLAVQVNPKPVADFQMPSIICVGNEFQVTFNGTASPTAQFNWNFGGFDVVSGNGAGPYTLSANTIGSFSVSLSITDQGCVSDLVTHQINVAPFPVSSIAYTGPSFVGQATQIDFIGNAYNGSNFTWSYNGATLISGNNNQNINISYPSEGSYPVLLTIDAGGCISVSDTLWIDVLPIPTAAINGNNSICTLNPLTLSYSGNATSNAQFFWDFDGGNVISGSGQGPYEVQWTTNGNKTVTVYIIENGIQSNLASHLVTVHLSPTAGFVLNSEACMNQAVTVQYIGTGSANAQFNWNFDDAVVVSGINQGPYDILFETSGVRQISLQVTENGCTSNLVTNPINILNAPIASFVLPEQTCKGAGVELVFNGTAGNNASFKWNVHGEVITVNSGQNNPVVQWDEEGNQTVSLRVYDEGCSSDSVSHQLMVRALPPVDAGANVQFCTGAVANLNAVSQEGMTYTWSPSSYLADINDPQTAINYLSPHQSLFEQEYVLRGFDGLCTGFDTVKVTVVPTPVAYFETPDATCINDQNLEFQAGGSQLPQANYLWDFGPNVSTHLPTQKNPKNINFNQPGNQIITLLISQMGCTSEMYVDSIFIYDAPHAKFAEQNNKGCEPLKVNFIGEETADGLTYQWSFGNGSTSSNRVTNHIYYEPGEMDVMLTVIDSNGCKDSEIKTKLVNVYPKPQADFRINPNMVFIGDEVSIVNLSEGGHNCMYIINNADTVYNCNTFYTFPQVGENYIELQIANSFGCVDTVIRSLTIDYGADYFIPAAFTPNFDGLNDEFKLVAPDATNFNMVIFDRWGQEIFETNDINIGWNGKIGNNVLPAPLGTYTYIMTFKTKNNMPREIRGTVTLLK